MTTDRAALLERQAEAELPAATLWQMAMRKQSAEDAARRERSREFWQMVNEAEKRLASGAPR